MGAGGRKQTFCVVFLKLNLARRKEDNPIDTGTIIDWWKGWISKLLPPAGRVNDCETCQWKEDPVCRRLAVKSSGVMLGPYDFALTLHAESIAVVERFVVGCLHAVSPPNCKHGGEVVDTQTFVGSVIDGKRSTRSKGVGK